MGNGKCPHGREVLGSAAAAACGGGTSALTRAAAPIRAAAQHTGRRPA
ncbi:hypothetical protein AB0K14_19950 [Actinosynnema sp. NPDC050801]